LFSQGDKVIVFTIVCFSWAFRFLISDDGSNLLKDEVIIFSLIAPAKWISPSSEFESVSGVTFSINYMWVKLSIIWSLMPLNKFVIVNVLISLKEFSEFTLNLLSNSLSGLSHNTINF
jgi:hypothetical protein